MQRTHIETSTLCVWAAGGEVLSYYHQQGITVVKATLLFDCLPPDAQPPGVAIHFRTSVTALCHSISLCLSRSVFVRLSLRLLCCAKYLRPVDLWTKQRQQEL